MPAADPLDGRSGWPCSRLVVGTPLDGGLIGEMVAMGLR